MAKRRKRGSVASVVIRLLPCPFCGNDGSDQDLPIAVETEPMPYVLDGREIKETCAYVTCASCGARGPWSAFGNDAGLAVDYVRSEWNERFAG